MSDIEDHYEATKDHMIDSYRVVKKLGTGTFGRVFLCSRMNPESAKHTISQKIKQKAKQHFNKMQNKKATAAAIAAARAQRDEEALQEAERQIQLVAVKVVRPVSKYVDEARDEAKVLSTIRHPRIAQLIEAREWKNRFLIVTQAYGPSIYHILEKRDYCPIRESLALLYTEQVLEALDAMHSARYVHTDIKPENILVEDVAHPEKGVRLIDMGGAIPFDDISNQLVQTRQYRAPEVILGMDWDAKVDVWSVGCMLAEMITGDVLFPAHDNRAHLAMIERVVGRFPEHMTLTNMNFEEGAVKFPSMGQKLETVERVCEQQPMRTQFKDRLEVYRLLRRMLVIDPEHRYSARDLLESIKRHKKSASNE